MAVSIRNLDWLKAIMLFQVAFCGGFQLIEPLKPSSQRLATISKWSSCPRSQFSA